MSKVTILSPDVIAKIAAGEAVERPASVVKELLENSIDAGATSIEINLKDAGKELIHIKDNGSGIAREDLEKLFQRHATSKISSMEDLEKLLSMGFRGEALYSIAAVSDVVLTTKHVILKKPPVILSPKDEESIDPLRSFAAAQDDKTAWSIHIRGGMRQNLQPASFNGSGTDIKISELFYNTPARRKFLKNNTSELNQILNVVLPYCLIYPEKRFVLNHAGRTLLDLKPAPSAIDRVAAALGVSMKHLLQTDQEFVQEQIRVQMILGDINIQRPRRDLQYFFINNRPVESKNLSFNLNDVYKLILPPGVYGAFIINITLNPANVDANIHPTKREVRLKDEARIISLLRRMTEYQLMHKGSSKHISFPNNQNMSFQNNQNMSFPHALSGNPETGLPADQLIFAPGQMQAKFDIRHPEALRPKDLQASLDSSLRPSDFTQNDKIDMPMDFQLFGQENTLRSKFTRARFIGAFLQKFLIFEVDQSLLLVDQHAAQERIMFEKFKNQLEQATIETQPLLTPVLMKLTPQEKITWEEMQEQLTSLGIESTQFDDDTIAIQSQPLLLKNIASVMRTLLAGGEHQRMDHTTLARRACKASIVAGDKLDISQADYQRKLLLECQDPFTCPHGRPTLIEITQDFLDRQFLRS